MRSSLRLLILWISTPRVRWSWSRFAELLTLLMCLVLTGEIIFCRVLFSGPMNYPIEYLCIPFLVWAALRFSQREAASAILALSGTAIWGTLHGFGPFAIGTRNESLLLLQAFMGIVAVMTLALAAMATEHRKAEEQIRNLAVTDPLTGLANYRMLIEILDGSPAVRCCARAFAVFCCSIWTD